MRYVHFRTSTRIFLTLRSSWYDENVDMVTSLSLARLGLLIVSLARKRRLSHNVIGICVYVVFVLFVVMFVVVSTYWYYFMMRYFISYNIKLLPLWAP